MRIGIVGHAADKFTPVTEHQARAVIRGLLAPLDTVLVSGGCHLGGVDIWAEEEARALGREALIFRPARLQWAGGFRERNLQIARESDEVHCIVVRDYPEGYAGRRWKLCYHCGTADHVKSGGCWTARRAKMKKWWILAG